ncbi:STAS-like domain-containing protein [Halorhodospira halophila]|uniref:STAS-like domain-containing protein n=1 Tax=Halorhodospira halophila TaxID=1053 RepID=UPI0019136EF4|nr:hypothetical protein [Halorhodospira halophila]
MGEKIISISKDFSRFPAGRFRRHGPYTGEAFREDILAPAIREHDKVTVDLDGTAGFGSSFLEEAFGGLTRMPEFSSVDLRDRVAITGGTRADRAEVKKYLNTGNAGQ